MVGQGFGPLKNPRLVARARSVLSCVNFIGLREERASRPLLQSLGVAPNRTTLGMSPSWDERKKVKQMMTAPLPSSFSHTAWSKKARSGQSRARSPSRCSSSSAFRIRSDSAFFRSSSRPSFANTSSDRAGKQLVQKFFLDRHVMILPLFIIMACGRILNCRMAATVSWYLSTWPIAPSGGSGRLGTRLDRRPSINRRHLRFLHSSPAKSHPPISARRRLRRPDQSSSGDC